MSENAVSAFAHRELRNRYRIVAAITLLLLLALAGFFVYERWLRPKPVDPSTVQDMLHKLDSMSMKAKTFENKNGQLVAENAALIVKSEGMLQAMSAAVFNLKDDQERLVKQVNYLTVVKQQTRYDTVFMHYDAGQTIPLIAEGRSDSIGVPQSFSFSDTSGSVYGRVLKNGARLDSVWVNNTLYLRHGVKKTGFMGFGRQDFVEAMNTNPHIRTVGLATATYHHRPSAWNRWIKPGIAAAAGAAITYKVMK